jgi:hypothetical protein
MTALFWSFLFETAVRSLPVLFLVGAPVLVIAMVLAAFADVKLPHQS